MEDKLNTLSELKSQLTTHLKSDELDHGLVLKLSHEIAALEEGKVRFSIDAGVIDRLGQELVARQETAVSELVKNSFDADAELVTLTFKDSDSIGGTLILDDDDDGDGMTRDELVNGFMRISSTSKIHNPISRTFKRQRAGQKGIGRFSVQRLGLSLTIITQVADSDFALVLKINWDDYQKDSNLLTIANELEVTKKVKHKGTQLVITGLRDKWSKAAIRRVYRYVSNIIQPFSLADVVTTENSYKGNIDPGFKALFSKQDGNSRPIKVADQEVMIYDHAVAEIHGQIDGSGIGVYTVDSKKLDINEIGEIGNDQEDSSVPFSKLKNVRFKAYYYIYDGDLLPKMHSTSIRKLAQREGGIKLYRNGFRVLPYAEPGNDWLDLDRSVRRRTILPQHANINFFGFVEIKDPDNFFNETSSREGIIENEAFIQLRNFVHRTILAGVLKVAAVRNIKQTPSQVKDDNGNYEEISVKIKNIAKTIEELEREFEEDSGGSKKRGKRKTKVIKDAIEELDALHKSELKKTIKERSMLRVLSSVGLTVSQFIHEIKHHMDHIKSDISFLISELEGNKVALERLTILDSNFESFTNYTSYFNDVVSQNIIRDIRPQNMLKILKSFVNSMRADASKSGIELLPPKFSKDWLYTKSMHPSEWSSVLFNFYTNSKKAIQRAKSNGKIFIECGEENDLIFLEFSDNGDGIELGEEEKIFDEFYTTTSVGSLSELDHNTEILGTGLGLKITKDIIKGYRGNIRVVSAKSDFSTCIRIEIGKATDKELDEHGI
ncbi:sensor histidine kinase [Aliivibrio finisterrensis]|uniref:histidine kinase n=1 Tax=Aliivibrio finisterrensis TaxID=511998 RepID=A0A4Q5KHB5_9GAMM|nr:ATP-binding protein [Aliivibrio finisterrensis]RYU45520.1 sensor histidine kinase [Aliivibrio finisterrensis]RYU68088.1 sensor histidine kinase [Aliivibrio finisterrensis]RYU71756.1 sensor histidine kinase [Aliivibrio finisterrensis]RYU75431.1 sensor histidine kinase [Aliivibrio finisterrensis]